MTNEIDLSTVQADPDVLDALKRMQDDLKNLQRERTPRQSKGTSADGLIAALNDALETETKGGKQKVNGRNRAFVSIFHEGYTYEDGTEVDADDLRECFAKLLETCEGVTVDRKKLMMSEVFGQWCLRVYNRPEVETLAKAMKEEE